VSNPSFTRLRLPDGDALTLCFLGWRFVTAENRVGRGSSSIGMPLVLFDALSVPHADTLHPSLLHPAPRACVGAGPHATSLTAVLGGVSTETLQLHPTGLAVAPAGGRGMWGCWHCRFVGCWLMQTRRRWQDSLASSPSPSPLQAHHQAPPPPMYAFVRVQCVCTRQRVHLPARHVYLIVHINTGLSWQTSLVLLLN